MPSQTRPFLRQVFCGPVFCAAALLWVAGCAQLFQDGRAPETAAQQAPPTLPPEKPVLDAPAAGDQGGAAEEPFAAARPFPPVDLIGVSQEEARVLFGAPQVISHEPPAEVWRYAVSPECRLALFFYLDVSDSAYRALTYEVTPDDTDHAACIGAVYEREQNGG